jgi:hypothetical protein
MRTGALLLAALATLACGSGDRDRRAAEEAVRAYDEALVRAFRASDRQGMRGTATEKEANRVLVLIDLKIADRLVLESTLERLDLLSADRVGPDGYTVRTQERWRYHDRPLDPGRTTGPELVAEMKMEYEVAREGGRWLVAKARTLSSEYLEPPGFKPGAPRGSAATAH